MGKKEDFRHHLQPLLEEYLENRNEPQLTEFLVRNSNLPGRRANLELARAFTETIEASSSENHSTLWDLLIKLTSITIDQAPVNDPKEFLPFCGTWALGAMGSRSDSWSQESLILLKKLAVDPRWRMREAVAKAIGKLAQTRQRESLEVLSNWISGNQWLQMRAVAAGVAESSLISDKFFAKQALTLHKKIFNLIKGSNARNEDFKVLKKGLSYTLSVVVASIPEEGFKYLYQLSSLRDKDISWIIRENLKKKRLSRNYPEEVKLLLADLK
ncbi:MAG: hypothetical protein ACFFD4_26685 [Candidatus Odinarchaeota archaeon]